MDERRHEEIQSLVAAYVLDAVPPEDVAAVRSHLLRCEHCMAEAESLSSVASKLGLSVPPEPLPEHVAERVMAEVRAERAEPSPGYAASARPRWWRASLLASAALLLVVGVLSFAVVDARRDLAREREVTEWLLSENRLQLHGPGVKAAVVPDDDGALFVAQGLEDPGTDRVYQIWLMTGACDPAASGPCTVESAGTFRPDDGRAVVDLEQPLGGYSRAAVTIEPDGGSESPTTDPIIDSAA